MTTQTNPRRRLSKAVIARYDHVQKVKAQADGFHGSAPWLYGWAVREAFVAGAKWQKKQ